MMVLRGLALSLAIVATACTIDGTAGEASRAQGIIGGDQSEPSEFPATGMLVARDHLICTATLIAPDVAITAAHCLAEAPPFGDFGFTLDTDAGDGFGDVVPVAVYHIHPGFDPGVNAYLDLAVRNDVGVMLLAHPIEGVVPEIVEQADDRLTVEAGDQLAMCGFGLTLWHTATLPIKRDAQLIVARAEANEFSTAAADPQPCNGDSGGPLFVDGPKGRRIVGLVSRAVGASVMCDTGAIITRLKPYADWIYLASHDHNTGGCSAGGHGAALPFGLIALAGLWVRRRRGAR